MTRAQGELSGWSVRFVVDERESGAISSMLKIGLVHDVRRLSLSDPSSDDTNEPSTVTFELDAQDGREARILAQHLLGRVKTAAGLKADSSALVWVAPLAGDSESSHRFLEAAEEFMDAERYDMAVVAAQIHLEVHVLTLVDEAMASERSPVARAAVARQRGWAPHHPLAQPLLDAVFGMKVDAFPRWPEYLAHVKRRNDVAHSGQSVDSESAKDSVAVVSEFWFWLNQAAEGARDP